jgi:uncharacterized protein YkwD
MRSIVRLLALALSAAGGLTACLMAVPVGTSSGAGASGGSAPQSSSADPRAASELVNRHRARVGCAALAWDERAARAAQGHSDDMARRNYFAHQSPEGRGSADRLTAQGVAWRAVAENIALHPGGAGDVVVGGRRIPGHRRNIENCTYTHHALGVRGDRWTHVFFTPR